jgi:hypothetical protein
MTFAVAKPAKRVENRDYRAFIRELPCIQCAIEGRETFGCDPAHRGKGTKVDDVRCVPSCRAHHDEQHADGNERRYWARYGLSPVLFCQALADAAPDVEAATKVVSDYATHARRGLPTVHVATGPVTRRSAGPEPVTITAHLAAIPRDAHGNIAVPIPREIGLKDAPCEIVWVAPIAVQASAPNTNVKTPAFRRSAGGGGR